MWISNWPELRSLTLSHLVAWTPIGLAVPFSKQSRLTCTPNPGSCKLRGWGGGGVGGPGSNPAIVAIGNQSVPLRTSVRKSIACPRVDSPCVLQLQHYLHNSLHACSPCLQIPNPPPPCPRNHPFSSRVSNCLNFSFMYVLNASFSMRRLVSLNTCLSNVNCLHIRLF